jgi:hypothetical protein
MKILMPSCRLAGGTKVPQGHTATQLAQPANHNMLQADYKHTEQDGTSGNAQKVPGSNSDRDTNYHDRGFHCFLGPSTKVPG